MKKILFISVFSLYFLSTQASFASSSSKLCRPHAELQTQNSTPLNFHLHFFEDEKIEAHELDNENIDLDDVDLKVEIKEDSDNTIFIGYFKKISEKNGVFHFHELGDKGLSRIEIWDFSHPSNYLAFFHIYSNYNNKRVTRISDTKCEDQEKD